jgi:chromosome segregation ATPase
MSSEEKMRLLEQALDRYRSVIEFQQERIRSDQEELRAARAEIERLEQALRESGYRAREHPSVVAEPELDVSRGKLESRAGGLAPD